MVQAECSYFSVDLGWKNSYVHSLIRATLQPIKPVIIHQRFSLARDLSKRITWLNILGNIRWYSPDARCEKYLKDNKHNSLHLALKICSDICPWTLSVPRSSTVRFSEQIMSADKYPSIFLKPNGDYCLYMTQLTSCRKEESNILLASNSTVFVFASFVVQKKDDLGNI